MGDFLIQRYLIYNSVYQSKKTQFVNALKSPKVLNSHIFLYVCLFQSVYYKQLTCLLVHNVHQKFLRDHKEFPASLAPALTLAAAAARTAVAYKGNTIGTRVWAREHRLTVRYVRYVQYVSYGREEYIRRTSGRLPCAMNGFK